MNPIYKFEIDRDGADRRQAFPNYKDDLSVEFAKESQQQFFRRKLSGKIVFLASDYIFISSANFDAKFGVFLSISYDGGSTWLPYWEGVFWKTDCEFDADHQTCTVNPEVNDLYGQVLDGQDKEYDLIKLAPETALVQYDKRPMIQIYLAGRSVIGCFMSGVWWEQEVTEAISSPSVLAATYHFSVLTQEVVFNVGGSFSPALPDVFYGTSWYVIGHDLPQTYSNGEWDLQLSYSHPNFNFVLSKNNVAFWTGSASDLSQTIYLSPVAGSGATGTVELTGETVMVFARLVCDVDSVNGTPTHDIPTNDIVANNRNYRKVVGYMGQNMIVFTDRKSSTPSEYGIYQPGQYYQTPVVPLYYGEFYPCARKTWGRVSVWFQPSMLDYFIENSARKAWQLGDCYSVWSAIEVLLREIAPDVSFGNTSDYSEFLFGSQNPITGVVQHLFLTQKSNVINSGYDQPAQKAPVTLKTILEMLRDCFRCYWFIENGKLRIEHISFFMNGGTYTGIPVVGRDLTAEQVTRNGKAWSWGANAWSFDKPDTFGRYQFSWMDDVTLQFEGFPIDILSGYVNKAQIESVSVSDITSDIDYILLNPSAVSQDGFVLMAAVLDDGAYKLPYKDFYYNDTQHICQNAYVAFMFLQNYYLFDMPAENFVRNGEAGQAIDTRRLKLQEIQFPCLYDPEENKLIKTDLGLGILEKISVNLSSRKGKATLKFPTR